MKNKSIHNKLMFHKLYKVFFFLQMLLELYFLYNYITIME